MLHDIFHVPYNGYTAYCKRHGTKRMVCLYILFVYYTTWNSTYKITLLQPIYY
uniref:Uncharacterized protein n=1 Tax=Setaria italica TaxID=4555 RepID=K3XUA4_SETIT